MGSRVKAGSFTCLMAALLTTSATAHEMFLKAPKYFVTANSDQVVRLINGTFDKSENSISRDRMADVSIAADGRITHPTDDNWYDDENSSYLKYRAGDPGTYVIGVSTRASIITMTPEDFVKYLEHEGILDTLRVFEKENTLTEVRERYSKHVRTIVQVGGKRSDDYSKLLGYPVEIILDQNPYDLKFGSELSFRVLYEGKPIANQIVRASYEGFHGHDDAGNHMNSYNLRTDNDGRARFLLSNKAVWYIALVHMQKVDDPDADYVSNWATVTFEVK
ncbi:MAG TPA: DUF4198 domain-containing protein [Woeseiaceae bacterium]|nr:DUF4198 domain-containing protein [Woeseiaceae bacterium]